MEIVSILAYIAIGILVINVILAGFVVFFERRNPASSWAWLFVLLFIPVFGFVIYMIFGRNSKREKMFRVKEEYDREVYYKYLLQDERCVGRVKAQKEIIEKGGRLVDAEYLTDLAYLHLNSGNWMTFNNKVTRFITGADKFEALVRDIRQAKEFIHLEYYIWRGDKLGTRLVEELTKKAEEGVEVRLLYDGMGNSRLPKDFFDNCTQLADTQRRFCRHSLCVSTTATTESFVSSTGKWAISAALTWAMNILALSSAMVLGGIPTCGW